MPGGRRRGLRRRAVADHDIAGRKFGLGQGLAELRGAGAQLRRGRRPFRPHPHRGLVAGQRHQRVHRAGRLDVEREPRPPHPLGRLDLSPPPSREISNCAIAVPCGVTNGISKFHRGAVVSIRTPAYRHDPATRPPAARSGARSRHRYRRAVDARWWRAAHPLRSTASHRLRRRLCAAKWRRRCVGMERDVVAVQIPWRFSWRRRYRGRRAVAAAPPAEISARRPPSPHAVRHSVRAESSVTARRACGREFPGRRYQAAARAQAVLPPLMPQRPPSGPGLAPPVRGRVAVPSDVSRVWRSTIMAALRSGTPAAGDPDASDASRNSPGLLKRILDIVAGQILIEAGALRQQLHHRLLQLWRQPGRRRDAEIGEQLRLTALLSGSALRRRRDRQSARAASRYP